MVKQSFSNTDFLTQGMELSREVSGFNSRPVQTAVAGPDATQAISRTTSRYSIDDLATLTTPVRMTAWRQRLRCLAIRGMSGRLRPRVRRCLPRGLDRRQSTNETGVCSVPGDLRW